MNREIESAIAMDDEAVSIRPVVAQATERIRRWFRRPYQDRSDREQNLLQEERCRERARIARELHDSLFQGFLGASLQLHNAVEQMPDDSPGKPTLSRALCVME